MKSSHARTDLNNVIKVRTPRSYPWQVLDKLVDDLSCSLTEDEIHEIKRIIRSRDYSSYLKLSETWGPQRIASSGYLSKANFFAKYQASALLKKFQFPSDVKIRREAAFKKFQAAEVQCKEFNIDLSNSLAYLTDDDELCVYTYTRQFLSKLLGEELPPRESLTFWSRHGPGSNLDTMERRISLYDKYSNWPYSCTESALGLARLAIQDDERWLGALEDDYREKMGIPRHLILNQEAFWSDVLKVVPGNRICFVPKNSQTDRSIAIEPCMNLYLQLGIDGYIRRRLKRWGIDLDDQQKNQELARLGALNWADQNPFVTLDLAAASDTISLRVCELLLPPQWYKHLLLLRSPIGSLDGEIISYEKISSMGNGFTFALESAIFAAICFAVQRHLEGQFNSDEIAVFGDDLIIKKASLDLTVRMLNKCGFTVNHEKSFVEGPFRESCGADWLSGTSVRPVFLQNQPGSVMELWNDANRLRRILTLRFGGFELRAVDLILRWVPPIFSDCVGPFSDESFDSYRHVPIPEQRYRNGLWKFKTLVSKPRLLKGDNFLMRKLMHSLRAAQTSDFPTRFSTFRGLKVSDAGSRFAITKHCSVVVGYSSSPASYWQDEYNDLVPRSL